MARREKSVNLQVIRPLSDSRWEELAARHPRASVFHQRGWLEALHRTYGYEPLAITSAPPGAPLQDAVVLCRVSSWLTGTRLVSLPFADHCEPLWDVSPGSANPLEWLPPECERQHCKYVEVRPLSSEAGREANLQPSRSYCFHQLDIHPEESQLFAGLHKSSIQRAIRRAECEPLAYESGGSPVLQQEFYRLLLSTRRRHRIPPQPRAWFTNLVQSMGENVLIRVARNNGKAIAAIFTLRHGSTVVYKYGCSDERFHSLGGMSLLFWRMIQESKADGAATIDLGRSDLDNQGLITFKDRWGASKSTLTYYRYPALRRAAATSPSEGGRRAADFRAFTRFAPHAGRKAPLPPHGLMAGISIRTTKD